MKVEEGFQQPIPELPNGYTDDILLPSLLRRLLPTEIQEPICRDLERLGNDLNGPIHSMGLLADSPPTLTQYSHWGRRIDTLQTSEGWRQLKALAAKEGLVSISYEREYGEWSRVYAFTKALLFAGEGRVVYCPIGMADGTARVLELLGTKEMKQDVMWRLTTRDPDFAFTSGQFMTERPGGSDVSLTETVARPAVEVEDNEVPGAKYRLNGFKWFSSATDSQVALALARTGDPAHGSRSLSLFLLPLRLPLPYNSNHVHAHTPSGLLPRTNDIIDDDGERINNGIEIHRMKSKIGTHAVPTAELSLNNSLAYLVGPVNGGVKAITPVLQITRVHSAFNSVGSLARCLGIATSFAKVRRIDRGRRLLEDVALHMNMLAKVAVTYRALLSFALNTAHLLGQIETSFSNSKGKGDALASVQARFRLLNPTLKAFATHHSVPAMEECMAALGGQGYMEETGIGRLIRDALVERIWEGTENIMALDVVRAAAVKEGDSTVDHWTHWAEDILQTSKRVHDVDSKDYRPSVSLLKEVVSAMATIFKDTSRNEFLPHITLLLFGHTNAALYLLEHAVWACQHGEPDAYIHQESFERWVMEGGVRAVGVRGLLEEFYRGRERGSHRVMGDRAMVFGTSHARRDKSKL